MFEAYTQAHLYHKKENNIFNKFQSILQTSILSYILLEVSNLLVILYYNTRYSLLIEPRISTNFTEICKKPQKSQADSRKTFMTAFSWLSWTLLLQAATINSRIIVHM